MGLPSINTREDLDAFAGTVAHDAFMALLAGTLWRVERDDTAQAWVAIEDNSTIERFGFTRAAFPGAQSPALPEYLPESSRVPQSITRAQAIGALILAGLDELVQPAIDAIPDPVQRKLAQNDWDNRLHFERDNPTLNALAAVLGLTDTQLDNLFIAGVAL